VRPRNGWLVSGLSVVLAIIVALGLFLWYLGRQERVRIVRSAVRTGGALMAVNSEGLLQLNEHYSLPKTCSLENMQEAKDLSNAFLCAPLHPPVTSQIVKPGVVVIPEGTRAFYLGRSFILPGGRLVAPYAANTYDMARDGAVEVERIRITQAPNENLEGWVEIHFLGRVCCGL
jgi:hypothetical protein